MILSNVNIGTGPSSGDGDPLRTAFIAINNNFQIVKNNVNALTNSVTSVAGRNGNVILTVNDIIGAASVAYVNSQLGNVSGYSNINVTAFLPSYAGSIATVTAANLAMKGYVDASIAGLVDSAPGTLDTLNELAAALGDDPNLSVTLTNTINSANTTMKAYVDGQITAANSAVTTANVGIIGYVNQANTIQSAQVNAANLAIVAANLGMKGYVDSVATLSSYGNANVASYLPNYGGNVSVGNIIFDDLSVQTTAYTGTQWRSNLSSNVRVKPSWLSYVPGGKNLEGTQYGFDSGGMFFSGNADNDFAYPIQYGLHFHEQDVLEVIATLYFGATNNDHGLSIFSADTRPIWRSSTDGSRIAFQFDVGIPVLYGQTTANTAPGSPILSPGNYYTVKFTYDPTNTVTVETFSGNTASGSPLDSRSINEVLPAGDYKVGFDADNDASGVKSYWTNLVVRTLTNTVVNDLEVQGQVTGNLIPGANVAYSLGSITNQWKDLFVSNNTIFIGGVPLSIDAGGTLLVDGSPVSSTATGITSTGTINITNADGGSNSADINLSSADDITLQARDRTLGSTSEGGDINIFAGDSAEDSDTGAGDIVIEGGRGGDSNVDFGGGGGTVRVQGGLGGAASTTANYPARDGGVLTLSAGDAGSNMGNIARGAEGGFVIIDAGDSTGNTIDGGGITLTTGLGGANALGGNVVITIPSSDLGSGGTWTFDGYSALTLPANGTIKAPNAQEFQLQAKDTNSLLRNEINLDPNNGTYMSVWSDEVNTSFSTSDWDTASWIDDGGGVAVITNAETLYDFWNTGVGSVVNNIEVSINGGSRIPVQYNSGNSITSNVSLDLANGQPSGVPPTSPTTITSLNFYYRTKNSFNIDYDGGEILLDAQSMDIDLRTTDNLDLRSGRNLNLRGLGQYPVRIYTDNTTHMWEFNSTGSLTLPREGKINGIGLGAASDRPGYMTWAGNSSGDGLGFNTMKLVPDELLESADQYIILDPTGGVPGHIHIRAGGVQDNSGADLYLGGENSHVKISAGANPPVTVLANNNAWTFGTGGNLTLPAGGQILDSTGNLYAAGSTYSNVQVATYLPTHTGNVQAGNVKVTSAYRFATGAVTITNGDSHVELSPDTGANALAGVKVSGNGYILGPNASRNITLNYGSTSGVVGLQSNVFIGTGGSGNLWVYGNVIARDVTASNISASGTSGKIGFTNGGFVQQITANSNGVSLNTVTGNIQLMGINLGVNGIHTVSFTNNKLQETDLILVSHHSGGVSDFAVGAYYVAPSTAIIWIRNITGADTSTVTPMLKFALIKAPGS